ncbi:hypothetical protein Tco_0359973, partial [Tanacetum coccineum]
TTTVRTVDNEEQQLHAIVDGKSFTITEASVKRHFQLADADGINVLPNTEIFDQLTLMGTSRRRAWIVLSDEEEDLILEDPSKQGRSMIEELDLDTGVLSAAKVLADATQRNVQTYARRRRSIKDSTASTTVSTASASMPVSTAGVVQREGKAIMEEFEDEQTKKTKQRIAKVHATAQQFTKDEWGEIKARVEADEELAQRFQEEERSEYPEEDQAKMLVELIDQRKKYFAAQKAEAKRNKPMTQAQQRTYMSNYIKNMGTTERTLELEDGDLQVEVRSLKRLAKEELRQESTKKQKVDEASGLVQEQLDEDEEELSQEDLQQIMMIVLVDAKNVEALQTKYQIINWEVNTDERDDLIQLWSLVKERFNSIEPTYDKEKELWVELKRLFELDNDDTLWKLQSSRGHDIYMLVERDYPLLKGVVTLMLVNKLLVD